MRKNILCDDDINKSDDVITQTFQDAEKEVLVYKKVCVSLSKQDNEHFCKNKKTLQNHSIICG